MLASLSRDSNRYIDKSSTARLRLGSTRTDSGRGFDYPGPCQLGDVSGHTSNHREPAKRDPILSAKREGTCRRRLISFAWVLMSQV
ncbi:uncharacterized protein SETTUDRAFT_155527 [Exserohilum turcica Et28A]|uniref:Uncharacterized protein n=1 Tax=Exserohilum turcicum (strain 28A) TaxID=671987 RepID=R0IG88_EXST2|nr:uncharacterized protein SETTUDRAFT_155527 [Exserohilum turcica Et28A]EOA84250.1 hypothetical protein SETTUDRAFT_155527 [Exserohilum turcica Et28A]